MLSRSFSAQPPSHVLHLGDCLAGMATLAEKSVDHVITDPPYSEHVHTKTRRGLSGHDGKGERRISEPRDLGFNSLTAETLRGAADQFARLARRWVLVFSDFESTHLWRDALELAGLEYVRTGCWLKVGAAPQFSGDRPAVFGEAITIAHPRGRKRWNGGGKMGLWEYPIAVEHNEGTARYHTAQKPEGLMEALVRDFSDPDESILDPFAGSATTLVAAKKLGRSSIGWERDRRFYAIAKARLERTHEQLGLWNGAA